jgi:hypothetical protein
MRPQTCLGGVDLPLEADHGAKYRGDQQANGNDVLRQIGLNKAKIIAGIHAYRFPILTNVS